MIVLELKTAASRLKPRELRELSAHIRRLTRCTPLWQKSMAKKLTAVSAGKFDTADALESKIRCS
jgi:hypothetical protein